MGKLIIVAIILYKLTIDGIIINLLGKIYEELKNQNERQPTKPKHINRTT